MRPYYDHAGITIYVGDCREVIPSLSAFDAVITDPPYGETSLEWDCQVRGWMEACERVTAVVWCFGSLQMFMDMARIGECSRWKRAQEIVWEKHNGSSFHADRFKRVHELAIQFYRGDWKSIYKSPQKVKSEEGKRVIRSKRPPHTGHIEKSAYSRPRGGEVLMRSVIYARSCHGEAEHPTQKPVSIIDPILRYSIPATGIVADPFMGSGSTLIAAKRLGLRAVGIEIEERYCDFRLRASWPSK